MRQLMSVTIIFIICLVSGRCLAASLQGDGGHRYLPCPATIVLHASVVAEGSTIAVTVLTDRCPVTAVILSGPGPSITLYADGNSFTGYYPVPLGTPAGTYNLQARLMYAFRTPVVLTVPVTVTTGDFPVQHLRVTSSMAALTTQTEQIADDRTVIATAYRDTLPAPLWSQPFIEPTSGRISTEFGHRRYVDGKFRSFHYGIDIAAPTGTPVVAVNCGRVIIARDFVLQGKTVIIDHGRRLHSIYYHLSEATVTEGQLVQRGDVIGAVGSTGYSTGPHLHWGFMISGTSVNPANYLHTTGPSAPVSAMAGDRP